MNVLIINQCLQTVGGNILERKWKESLIRDDQENCNKKISTGFLQETFSSKQTFIECVDAHHYGRQKRINTISLLSLLWLNT